MFAGFFHDWRLRWRHGATRGNDRGVLGEAKKTKEQRRVRGCIRRAAGAGRWIGEAESALRAMNRWMGTACERRARSVQVDNTESSGGARCVARNLRQLRMPKRDTRRFPLRGCAGNKNRGSVRSRREKWTPPGVRDALVREHALGDTAWHSMIGARAFSTGKQPAHNRLFVWALCGNKVGTEHLTQCLPLLSQETPTSPGLVPATHETLHTRSARAPRVKPPSGGHAVSAAKWPACRQEWNRYDFPLPRSPGAATAARNVFPAIRLAYHAVVLAASGSGSAVWLEFYDPYRLSVHNRGDAGDGDDHDMEADLAMSADDPEAFEASPAPEDQCALFAAASGEHQYTADGGSLRASGLDMDDEATRELLLQLSSPTADRPTPSASQQPYSALPTTVASSARGSVSTPRSRSRRPKPVAYDRAERTVSLKELLAAVLPRVDLYTRQQLLEDHNRFRKGQLTVEELVLSLREKAGAERLSEAALRLQGTQDALKHPVLPAWPMRRLGLCGVARIGRAVRHRELGGASHAALGHVAVAHAHQDALEKARLDALGTPDLLERLAGVRSRPMETHRRRHTRPVREPGGGPRQKVLPTAAQECARQARAQHSRPGAGECGNARAGARPGARPDRESRFPSVGGGYRAADSLRVGFAGGRSDGGFASATDFCRRRRCRARPPPPPVRGDPAVAAPSRRTQSAVE
eukprot:ctg_510.g309